MSVFLYSTQTFKGDDRWPSLAANKLISPWPAGITVCRAASDRAFLLTAGAFNRKEWLEDRVQELAEIFAVGVGGFSVMENHLHVLLRLDPDVAQSWSDEEVTRRWGRLFPPRDKSRQPLPVTEAWVQDRLKDVRWVAKTRERLQSISWFMKCLKEPLARLANREDGVRGAFFQSRFKSVAILDEEALLAVGVYIDLNPVAAGIAETPEASEYTSIKARVEHVEAQGQTARLEAAAGGGEKGQATQGQPRSGRWVIQTTLTRLQLAGSDHWTTFGPDKSSDRAAE